MSSLDLTPQLDADIFGEFTESRFTVSDEESDNLWNQMKEEYGPMSPIPFISSKSEKEFSKKLSELEQIKLDNKINHISAIVGAPVENVGLNNFKDMALVFDLSRNKYFQTRQKKFKEYYPEGTYQQLEVNLGGNKTDTIELFKYNSSDETWKISNPYGRDLSEIARVGGAIFNLPVVGDTLAVMSKKAKMLKSIPMTARVMIANYLGLKGDKAIEWARGYGEEEFASAENLGDVNWSGFATDLSDWSGAAISGAFYKGADAITQYFTKGKKPGLVDLGPDMVKAANALGVEPLVYAQIVANPIIRRLFNTSGEFVTTPGTVRADQAKSLLKSLQKYGISDQTQATIAKNIAEGVPDQNILSLQQVIDLEDALKLKLGDAMKVFGNDFPTNDTLKQNLDEVLSDLNVVQNNKKNYLTSKIFGTKKQGFKTGVSNIDGSFVNLREFRNELTKQLKPFRNNTVKYTDEKIINEAGEVVTKTVRSKEPYKDLPKEFQPILKSINDMLAIPKSMKDQPGFSIGTLTQLKDKNMDGLRTLFQIREDLFDLTLNSQKPEIVAAARELHKKLIGVLDNDIGGNDAFISGMKALNAHTKDMEMVKHLGFVRDSLGKSTDPDQFIYKFVQPGSPIKLQQLKDMLTHGSLDDKSKAAGDAAFNMISKKWYTTIFKNADDTTLNKWITDDPDGLKLMLGDNWKTKVSKMREIIDLTKRVQSGVTAQLQLGTNREFAESIIKQSQQEGVPGLDREFNVILQDLGGINGPGAEMLRMHIIKKMLDKSMREITKGKEMGQMSLSPGVLKEEIRKLQANSYLMKFFDEEQIKALSNYNLYTTALSGGSDVGAILAAGADANKLTEGMFKPQTWWQTGFTIFKHDLIAQILSRKQTASLFNKLDIENVLSETNLDLINITMAELAKSSTGYGEEKGTGVSGQIDADLISKMTNRAPVTNIAEDSGMASTPEFSFNRVDVPVNNASRLANTSLFNAAGMRGSPTSPINPNTMAKGSQLFNRPGEITFAAKGGIMNTTKAFQRVA